MSGRHLLLSVIRFRECQYSVMRKPARVRPVTGSAGNISRPLVLFVFRIHYSRYIYIYISSTDDWPAGPGLHFSTRRFDIPIWQYRALRSRAIESIKYCISAVSNLTVSAFLCMCVCRNLKLVFLQQK